MRGITLIQLTRGSLVLQVILSSSSCAASPPLISARPLSLSLSQQAQCGPLCLVMVVQCAPYSRLFQRRRLELNHDLHRMIKAIASIARPSLEQVWSGKGWWCGAARTHTVLDFNQGPRPDPGTVGSRAGGGLMHPHPDKNCFAPKQLPPLLQCDPSLNGGEAGISSRVPGKGSYGQVTALFKLLISHSCSISFQKISITSK